MIKFGKFGLILVIISVLHSEMNSTPSTEVPGITGKPYVAMHLTPNFLVYNSTLCPNKKWPPKHIAIIR